MKLINDAASKTCIDVSSWITLRWVRGTRYYRVHLEQDLWRNWLLTQVNGRIGTRLGRARSKPTPSIENALLDLADIAKRRRQRGYELIS
jgi:WGR domain